MKMKICYIGSAGSIHTKRWVKYFADKGHEVHWISLDPSIFNSIENVNYYEIKQFPLKVLNIVPFIFKMKKLIKTIKPEVLHIHYAGTNGLVGTLSGFHPMIITAWGSDVLIAGKSKIKRPLVKFVLNKADLITCDADHMIDAMARLGIEDKKIRLIYFGVDTHKFRPGEKNENLRYKLDVSNSPTVISLRNLEPIYDIETLIKAMTHVLKEIPDVKFVVAGTGSEEWKLKNLAKSLGVLESIRFVGFISNDELPQYLTLADIYVSTSLSDAGIASSTAEAMACGLPVIITDSGENRKWVKDGENGFIIPVKMPEFLAEKIVSLLKNSELGQKFSLLCIKIIEEKNNYYMEMEKMERIYDDIIKDDEYH